MANRYLLHELPPPGRHEVDGELAHHVGRVLRAHPGDTLLLGDGRGYSATAQVLAVGRHAVTVQVEASRFQPPARPRLTVAFACPRLPRVDWLIEHGTEVGIRTFQPLWTERSRPQQLRLERWRKIARAAAGQCDRAWLPTIAEPLELADWLACADLPPLRLLADAHGELLATGDPDEAALLVGPEGGFTPDERSAALARGFTTVRYGPHTLRTETAALCGAAVLLAHAHCPPPP